jgi:hypothetical protein
LRFCISFCCLVWQWKRILFDVFCSIDWRKLGGELYFL